MLELGFIVLDFVQRRGCEHRQRYKKLMESHLDEAIRQSARIRVKRESSRLDCEDFGQGDEDIGRCAIARKGAMAVVGSSPAWTLLMRRDQSEAER